MSIIKESNMNKKNKKNLLIFFYKTVNNIIKKINN